MKFQAAACLAATLLLGVTGCTTPQATTRGQSVQQVGHQDHNVNTLPFRTGARTDSIQNYFHDKHAYGDAASYHSTSGFPGYSGFAGSGAACPGGCPPGGCPSGQCGHGYGCGSGSGNGCNLLDGVPHHYHSYSYERPGNLCYPAPNAVGGSVVYPYYTHKGPSDFFRDDCDDR